MFSVSVAKIDGAVTLVILAIASERVILANDPGSVALPLGLISLLLIPRVQAAWWAKNHPWWAAWAMVLTVVPAFPILIGTFTKGCVIGSDPYGQFLFLFYVTTTAYAFVWMLVTGWSRLIHRVPQAP